MLEPGWPRPESCPARGRGGSKRWILAPMERGWVTPVCLSVFLDLVNDHAARLVGRKRLRVIAVARMHPHT